MKNNKRREGKREGGREIRENKGKQREEEEKGGNSLAELSSIVQFTDIQKHL